MDTKKLVVGQAVYVGNYVRFCRGKVVKVTPDGVEVQTEEGELRRFDNKGEWYDGERWLACVPVLDTKTLVVGQEVYMRSGCYGNKGKVVKVTPEGVDVQTPEIVGGLPSIHAELLHFDANGRSYVTELPPSYDSTAHPASPWRWDGNGTFECGPWYITTCQRAAMKVDNESTQIG